MPKESLQEAKDVQIETPSRRRRCARPNTVVVTHDIPRYRLFELLKQRAIRSYAIRRPGSKRVLRLIDLDSLEEYLARHATEAVSS
jgi:hypothetical protein